MKYYTGIGSRSTPLDALTAIKLISKNLDERGYTLRSGAADGADTAFEALSTNKEIWIPWSGFNHSRSSNLPSAEAFNIASTVHPKWNYLTDPVKKLHARNIHQVLGADLKTPSLFVLCWTPNGEVVGGTATAIRLAIKNNVPVLNFGKYDPSTYEEVLEDLLILTGEYNEV